MKIVLNGPIKGICSRPGLWVESGAMSKPLVYFQKPKWIKDDTAWKKFIRGALTMISAEGQAALNEILESTALDREVRNG